jgi:hypothetical protein
MSHMARSIPNLYRDAPVLSIIQRRKLAAMKKGSLTFAPIAGETLRLPSLSSSVMDNNISNSSSTDNNYPSSPIAAAFDYPSPPACPLPGEEQEQAGGGGAQVDSGNGRSNESWWSSIG